MIIRRMALCAVISLAALAGPAAAQTDAAKLLQVLRSGQASAPRSAAPTGADIAARPIEVAAMPVTPRVTWLSVLSHPACRMTRSLARMALRLSPSSASRTASGSAS